MKTLLAPDPAEQLIDLSDPDNPFQRMKACSVVTYGVTTLLRMPWSGLHRRNERGPASLALDSHNRWTVKGRGSALVGTYERAVFRALEWIAIDASIGQGVPFENPLIIHPRDLCERLCWRATQSQFEAIEQAMHDLCRVEIATGTSRFGLLRSVIAGTQRSAVRSLSCPHFVVYFDRFFVDSVNLGRIRPINWGLWIALRDPLSQRLLEIIDPEFMNTGGTTSAEFEIESLGRLLPLGPSVSRARRHSLLEPAHDALIRRGYLRDVERRGSGHSEMFRYRPGPTFHAMRHRLEEQPAALCTRRFPKDIAVVARGRESV